MHEWSSTMHSTHDHCPATSNTPAWYTRGGGASAVCVIGTPCGGGCVEEWAWEEWCWQCWCVGLFVGGCGCVFVDGCAFVGWGVCATCTLSHTNTHKNTKNTKHTHTNTHKTHTATSSVTAAAQEALLSPSTHWPLPVTLRHILRPLLLLLGEHPSVAMLLVELGVRMGPAHTLEHLVPALVSLLVVDGGRPEAEGSGSGGGSPYGVFWVCFGCVLGVCFCVCCSVYVVLCILLWSVLGLLYVYHTVPLSTPTTLQHHRGHTTHCT